MNQTIRLEAELWEAEQALGAFDEVVLATSDGALDEGSMACLEQLKAQVEAARQRVVAAQSQQGSQPTRKQLEHALAGANARLESPFSRSDQVFGTGVIEGVFGDARTGSRALLKEIASLERALNGEQVLSPGNPGDVRH